MHNSSLFGRNHFQFRTRFIHKPVFLPRSSRLYYPVPITVPVPESRERYPVIYRGEGRGARVLQPDRDRLSRGGEASSEGTPPRGVVYPRVARVLQENALGEPSTWADPRTGAATTVTPTRDLDGVEYCREFSHAVSTSAGQIEATGVACRTPEGNWERVL